MDKLEQYRQFIQQILTEHAQHPPAFGNIKAQLIFDCDRDHYQLIYIGWQGKKRAFGPIMHFSIENGKIWIQYNGTEESVAERLVEMGVPPTDIVIGFHSEFKRKFTDYAVK